MSVQAALDDRIKQLTVDPQIEALRNEIDATTDLIGVFIGNGWNTDELRQKEDKLYAELRPLEKAQGAELARLRELAGEKA